MWKIAKKMFKITKQKFWIPIINSVFVNKNAEIVTKNSLNFEKMECRNKT